MATRFCGNCGTEVDDDASFCPSCGRAIESGVGSGTDQTAAIPAAPAWPEPAHEPDDAPPPPAADVQQPAESEPEPEPAPVGMPAASQVPPTPPPAADRPPAPHAPGPGAPQAGTQIDLPVTWPVTLSGWLIGGGSFVAAVGFLADMFAFRGAGSAVSIILLLLTLGIAATVFLSATVPAVPHLRLATLCIVFIAFGIALDRLGFNAAGFGTLLVLLGAGAAAAGAVILELGRDQPMAGPLDRR
ncbi:MAG: zinc ribbon domain-containing protein [Chloroflexota bacterium]